VNERFFPFSSGVKSITPEMAGWRYSGLVVISITAGKTDISQYFSGDIEAALIPLNLQNFKVNVSGHEHLLVGRSGVFVGASDWVYIASNEKVEIITETAGEVAIATACVKSNFPSCYVEKISKVEIRGAGMATREVRPFMHPDVFPNAEKLMAVEVITPDGNVSSFPPHRHDGIKGCDVENEEIYYFRIGKISSTHGDSEGFGLHRTYSAPEDPDFFDETVTIHDGDIYLVPRGYHGPCAAMPGYPMYYLNVLAGPSRNRTMDFCDDPNHAWLRDSWKNQIPDPRAPWQVKQ
jgi:5-deoxy-glucuronate isomerase